MIDLKSMTMEEMKGYLSSLGEPAFRAKQVFQWLYRGAVSFDEMTDLPKVLRQKLEDEPDHPKRILTVRGVGYRFAEEES